MPTLDWITLHTPKLEVKLYSLYTTYYIMKFIKQWLFGKSKHKCQKEAQYIYQICECDGKLWLTFNGALVCPTEMLSGNDSVKALQEIRDLYVQRNNTEEQWLTKK